MNRPLDPHDLDRWLAAEDLGAAAGSASSTGADQDAEAADAALFQLLAGAPLSAPAAGFADRVMTRVASAHGASAAHGAHGAKTAEAEAAEIAAAPAPQPTPWRWQRPAWARRPSRRSLGLAACVAAALMVPAWPALLIGLRSSVSATGIAWLLQRAIGAAQGIAELTATLASWGNVLLVLLTAVAKPLATGPVAVLALLALGVFFLSLRSLRALIQRDRRWVYADPI